MAEKQQRIGKNGQVKIVVKKASSREKRVKEHMHGRSDRVHRKDDGKFVFAVIFLGLALIFLFWLGWKLIG